MEPYRQPEFWPFHSAAWWRRHLQRTGPFAVLHAADIPNGVEHWLHQERIVAEVGSPDHYPATGDDIPLIEAAIRSESLALVEVIAREPEQDSRDHATH